MFWVDDARRTAPVGLVVFLFVASLGINSLGRIACASPVDAAWLVTDRTAIDMSDCEGAVCGRIVWLRNPDLRTPEMCGRTIVWA
jgi:hypothetical protein